MGEQAGLLGLGHGERVQMTRAAEGAMCLTVQRQQLSFYMHGRCLQEAALRNLVIAGC